MVEVPPIRLERVTLGYGRRPVVRDLTGQFLPGSLTALIGPNGAGKTTLLRCLAGLHAPASGRIDRGGLAPRDIALLPQGGQLDRRFPMDCGSLVGLGLYRRIGPFAAARPAQRDIVARALSTVGLADYAKRRISDLSAGEFQRVLFARLIVQDTPVLLLDEPFTGVDAPTAAVLLALIRRWHAEGRTIVTVLHDIALVRDTFPEALLIAADGVTWGPTRGVLDHLRSTFGAPAARPHRIAA